MLKQYDLSGQTALVTGAAGLLGVEHTSALLEAGAAVVMTDFNPAALASSAERVRSMFDASRVITHTMDVTSTGSIATVADALAASGKRIDILVNNAAIDPKVQSRPGVAESSRLEDFPLEQWNLQVAVGLTGAFLCSQRFGAAMAADGRGGVILNIASDLSVIAPDQRLYRQPALPRERQPVKPVTYSVIKTGLIGLTRYLATYWADRGVRCNALSPGGVQAGQGDVFVSQLTSLIPMGRMAARDEYRGAIQFLCAPASRYLNGQNIVMDGGRSVW